MGKGTFYFLGLFLFVHIALPGVGSGVQAPEIGLPTPFAGLQKLTCVVFFSPSNLIQKNFIIYASFVQEKFRDKGLRLFAIAVNDSEDRTEALAAQFQFTTFIRDKDLALSTLFHARECCGAVFFFDQNRQLRFGNNALISNEDFRTLVEKYLCGKISYFDSEHFPFFSPPGFASLLFSDLVTGEAQRGLSAPTGYSLITFFSDICSSCRSGQWLSKLVSLRKQLNSTRHSLTIKIVDLFPDYYSFNEVAERGFIFDDLEQGSYSYTIIPLELRYWPLGIETRFPVSFLIDKDGKVLRAISDGSKWEEFEQWLLELIL